jgi:hypothetical protein
LFGYVAVGSSITGGDKMTRCEKFIPTKKFSQPVDECLKCGLTEKAHVLKKVQEIQIERAGKLWKFKSWEEANRWGFFLGD